MRKNGYLVFDIFMFQEDSRLERMRAGSMREIRMMRLVLYIATAAAMAAAAADFESHAPASALGNLGLLFIMGRLFILTPLVIARTKKGSNQWLEAEYDNIQANFSWADLLGKAGWVLLMVSVFIQIMTGAA